MSRPKKQSGFLAQTVVVLLVLGGMLTLGALGMAVSNLTNGATESDVVIGTVVNTWQINPGSGNMTDANGVTEPMPGVVDPALSALPASRASQPDPAPLSPQGDTSSATPVARYAIQVDITPDTVTGPDRLSYSPDGETVFLANTLTATQVTAFTGAKVWVRRTTSTAPPTYRLASAAVDPGTTRSNAVSLLAVATGLIGAGILLRRVQRNAA